MFKQLLIIKNETKIDKVDNICEGSYYISFLTENLLKESFDLFKKIEKRLKVKKNTKNLWKVENLTKS